MTEKKDAQTKAEPSTEVSKTTEIETPVEDTMTFYERIGYVQKMLKAPKNNYNSFGKYSYRSAEDILEAAKPLCVDNGIVLFLTDKPVVVEGWHYIEATASLYDMKDYAREPISVTAFARESFDKKGQDPSQITGTASSYARKYALNGLFLIDDTKDADTDEYQKQTVTQTEKKITKQEAEVLQGMLSANQTKWVLNHCNVKSLNELTQAQYTSVMNGLKRNDEVKSGNK